MPSIEILAPAGSMESLDAALAAGADAIYCAGKNFGARAYAANFDHDQLIEAVDKVHLYGAKLYVTMNTLIFEDEMEDAFKEACFLYEIGVDAVLIQDLGLFDLIHHRLPDFPLHCSTQMHIHDAKGVRFAKSIGASRVVLARECTRETVQACCKEGVEIEVFGYGALCSAYSGECLISAYSSGRSGNRGQCAQNCRHDYTLFQDGNALPLENGRYLMSLKDLNLIEKLPDLINDGVTSVKIEGRMKSPAYVYAVTSLFVKARAAYDNHQPFVLSNSDIQMMKLLFNRGFTLGYYYHQHDQSLRSSHRPNHQGVPIGKVIAKDRGGITIALTDSLSLHDGLRVLNRKEDVGIYVSALLDHGSHIKKAEPGMIVTIPGDFDVTVKDTVVKTSDCALVESIAKCMDANKNRIYVDMTMDIHGTTIDLSIIDQFDRCYRCTVENIGIQPAKNQPLHVKTVTKSFSKLKETPFVLNRVTYNGADVFLSMSALNQCRRVLVEGFMRSIISGYKRMVEPLPYPCERFDLKMVEPLAVNIKYGSTHHHPLMHTISESFDGSNHLAPLIYPDSIHEQSSIYIQYIGDIDDSFQQIGLFGILCANSYALQFYYRHRLIPMIAFECDPIQSKALIDGYTIRNGQIPVIYYQTKGNIRLMSMSDCLIKAAMDDPIHCNRCHDHGITICDHSRKSYRLEGDHHCILHLYTKSPYDRPLIDGAVELITIE